MTGQVLRPSYDNQDNLWIMDKADSAAPRLRVRNRGGDVSPVKTSFRGDTPVVLRMAPDGVRALLVMKSKTTGQNYVQTGTVLSGGQRQAVGARAVPPAPAPAQRHHRRGVEPSRASWSSA